VSSFTRRAHRASSPLELREAAGCGSCNARTSLVRPCKGCQEDLPLALPEHRNRAALSGPSRKWQIQSRPSSLRGLPGCVTALQFLLSSTPAHSSLELRHHHTICCLRPSKRSISSALSAAALHHRRGARFPPTRLNVRHQPLKGYGALGCYA